MVEETRPAESDATATVLAAARRMGVELDAREALEWAAALSEEAGDALTIDVDSGVYGHRVTLADHDAAGLARFRRIASIVGIEDRPPHVLTALALSGSAAQSRVHRFPADCDFFERVHIRAVSREEACDALGAIVRDKARSTLRGSGYCLHEVKFGTWPATGYAAGETQLAGTPVSWRPNQVDRGEIEFRTGDHSVATMTWTEAAREPGFCKLDWIVADPDRGGVSKASNVLDVTWEAPDGTISPLDGFLDPYFQEVYLETDSIPLFTRLVKEMSADSVAEYVERLTQEVYRYTVIESNHGKAARRMYNIFRLTGRYAEAAYIRELFDEPATALYQVAALLRTLHEAADTDGPFETEVMVAHVDQLIMSSVAALEGRAEAEMVRRLLRLRDALSRRAATDEYAAEIAACRRDAMAAVDDYFERALAGVPSIKVYLDEVAATQAP